MRAALFLFAAAVASCAALGQGRKPARTGNDLERMNLHLRARKALRKARPVAEADRVVPLPFPKCDAFRLWKEAVEANGGRVGTPRRALFVIPRYAPVPEQNG